MKLLTYAFDTRLNFSEAVTQHSFLLRCLPKNTPTQRVLEAQVFTQPRIPMAEQTDGFGNRILVGYCPETHEVFDYHAAGLVMVDAQGRKPEPAHPMYLGSTPLTQADEALRKAAEGLGAHEGEGCAWDIAKRACNLVFEEFTYTPGATSVKTSAAEAFAARQGVCQDYAHVLIALCRCKGIPARYVSGLMIGEGATHAWVEVHDGNCWRGLDPTHDEEVGERYMVFVTGRDFDDCPIERGVFRGQAAQTQVVNAALRQTQE